MTDVSSPAAGGHPVPVRFASADDWESLRDLRLRMLADTPIAFGDSLAAARDYSDAHWIARATRMSAPGSVVVVADAGERFVGTMSAFISPHGRAHLVTVYLDPDFRGAAVGLADELLDRVEQWLARSTDARDLVLVLVLVLSVHEDNRRAQRFYRRRGFIPTGRTSPYPLDRTRRELEFSKPFRP